MLLSNHRQDFGDRPPQTFCSSCHRAGSPSREFQDSAATRPRLGHSGIGHAWAKSASTIKRIPKDAVRASQLSSNAALRPPSSQQLGSNGPHAAYLRFPLLYTHRRGYSIPGNAYIIAYPAQKRKGPPPRHTGGAPRASSVLRRATQPGGANHAKNCFNSRPSCDGRRW